MYAYLAVCSIGDARKGLLVALAAACVSTLASIPVTIVATSLVQQMGLWPFALGYLPALPDSVIIGLQFVCSAVLGWLVAVRVVRLLRCFRSLRVHLTRKNGVPDHGA
jgi:hypothetical protein